MNSLNRNPYFDFLRGLAVFMVVSIHTFPIFFNFKNISIFALSFRQIMNVAVPLFCVSSAYFLIEKDLSNDKYVKFLIKQILKVYIPCLFFSLPYFVFDIKNGCNLLKSLVKFFTCSYSIYYFIALIIQFYILLPCFQKIKLFQNKLFGFVISFIWITTYIYVVKKYLELPLIIYGGFICCFFAYFSIGATVNKDEIYSKKLIYSLFILVIIGFFATLLESHYLMNKSISLTGAGLKSSCLIFCIPLLIILFSRNVSQKYISNPFFRIIENIGKYSLGIYLLHLYLIKICEKFLIYNNTIILNRGGQWIICSVLIVFVCFGILCVIKKMLPRFAKIFLGV